MEHYKEIPFAKNYLVSNLGNVKSKRYNKPLKGFVNNSGYWGEGTSDELLLLEEVLTVLVSYLLGAFLLHLSNLIGQVFSVFSDIPHILSLLLCCLLYRRLLG